MSETCHCGHVRDEHLGYGDDPEAPNATDCQMDDCDCFMFDEDPDAKEE